MKSSRQTRSKSRPQVSAKRATPEKRQTPEKRGPKQVAQRLQKVMAAAGIGSRRYCEELILEGRVEVDRQIVSELGVRVDPSSQEILVDGGRLKKQKFLYYMLNKPAGVMSTNRDPAGRPRVVDLIPEDQHMFTIGRLDKSSEGLILVTNDGELTNRLAHPRYGIEKTYHVEVVGYPVVETLKKLRKGVHLAEGFCRVERIYVKRKEKKNTILEMVLREGKNREIRRVLARVGHKVLNLRRVAMGPLRLGELPVGAHRQLTPNELNALKKARPAVTPKKAIPKKPAGISDLASPAKKTGKKVSIRRDDPQADKPSRGRAGKTQASAGRTHSGSGRNRTSKFGKATKRGSSAEQKKGRVVKGRR